MKKKTVEEMVQHYLPDYQEQRSMAEELDRWVTVQNEQASMPKERTTEEYRTLQEIAKTPWARLIVTEVAQSLYVDGYRHSGDSDNSPVWGKIWQPNGLDARQIPIHRGALNHGLAYGISLPGKDDTSVVRGVSARKGIALFRDDPLDPEDEWPLVFMQVDEIRSTTTGPLVNRIALVDEERIYYVHHEVDSDRYTYIDERVHGTGVVPVVRFANQLDLDGESMGEIEPVLPLLRRIDQDAFDRLVIQRGQSWQVRWATGMEMSGKSDADLDRMNRKMAVTDVLAAENPESRFGSLPATSSHDLVQARDSDIRDLAAATQTPPHHMLGLSPNVSAEGLVEAQASLMRKIEERQASFGDSWERLLRLSAYQMGMTKEAGDFAAEVRWRDTESRSLNQVADALGKMAKLLGVPPQMLWERLPDWTDQDTERALELLRDESDEQELLRRMTSGTTSAEVAADVATSAAEATTPGSGGSADAPATRSANRRRGGYGPDWDGDGKVG